MKLGLWYVPGTDDDVAKACALAMGALEEAGVTPAEGYAALLRASAGEWMPGDAPMIRAWYEAESAALLHLQGVTGVWPEQGALIVEPE